MGDPVRSALGGEWISGAVALVHSIQSLGAAQGPKSRPRGLLSPAQHSQSSCSSKGPLCVGSGPTQASC